MKNCAAAIFLFIWLLSPGIVAADLEVKAGVGYEFVSQEYFIDSLLAEGEDSLAAQVSLKTDYLDDIKGFVSFRLDALDRRRLELRAKYEQTPDLIRLKFYSDSRLKLGNHGFLLTNELDWRSRYNGETEQGDEYVYGNSRARLSLNLNDNLSQWWQVRGSFVEFDSTAGFSYNYYRVEGSAGLSRIFNDFSVVEGHVFANTRQVTDSTDLNYTSYGAEGNLLVFHDKGDLDLSVRLERRDYKRPDQADDNTRLEIFGSNKVIVNQRFSTRQELELDFSAFSDSDLVNTNYMHGEIVVQGGVEADSWRFWFGPEIDWLAEGQDEYSQGEDYFELGTNADINVLTLGGAFGSLESAMGHRSLRFDSDFNSDFWYERLSLMGDLALKSGLNLNVLFSAEWEWHDNSDENNRLFLLSSSLSYRF